ncbi:hypothetical protein ACHWQZ_G006257 [Mnemiopsis leidyi]
MTVTRCQRLLQPFLQQWVKVNSFRLLSTEIVPSGSEGPEEYGGCDEIQPSVLDNYRTESRRFVFEQPGTNIKNLASYLRGDYPGWSPNFLPHLDINDWQRKVMFDRECERALFLQDPGQYEMEELGFSRQFEVRDKIPKIEEQIPTDFVLYHDLREMWKRRQSMDLPFVNVGSFVEVKCRSKWDLTRPVTYGGLVIEKEHRNLNAFFVIRKNVSSYGYGVENLIQMYSPWLESVKVISYQVRDDPDRKGTLHSVRDLTPDQTELQDPIPSPLVDPESNLEIPHFEPLRLEYREQKKQKRYMMSSRHLRPRRSDTTRNEKLWVPKSQPDIRYPRPSIFGHKYRQ